MHDSCVALSSRTYFTIYSSVAGLWQILMYGKVLVGGPSFLVLHLTRVLRRCCCWRSLCWSAEDKWSYCWDAGFEVGWSSGPRHAAATMPVVEKGLPECLYYFVWSDLVWSASISSLVTEHAQYTFFTMFQIRIYVEPIIPQFASCVSLLQM